MEQTNSRLQNWEKEMERALMDYDYAYKKVGILNDSLESALSSRLTYKYKKHTLYNQDLTLFNLEKVDVYIGYTDYEEWLTQNKPLCNIVFIFLIAEKDLTTEQLDNRYKVFKDIHNDKYTESSALVVKANFNDVVIEKVMNDEVNFKLDKSLFDK